MYRTKLSTFFRSAFLLSAVSFLWACGEAPKPEMSPQDKAEVAATAETHATDKPVASPVATTPPAREVITSRIAYGEVGDKNLHGYLSVPADTTGSLPALIVIHEWWGLNDNIIATSERLASEGYITLAVDLFDEEVARTPKEAMKLIENLMANQDIAIANLTAAYAYLDGAAAAPKVGVIGWCAGGRWSLQTALALPKEIDAMVMYYGAVETDMQRLETLQMPILGLFAGDDPIVPRNTVDLFQKNLLELGKDANIVVYEGAKHAFSNPSGLAYNKEAADDAWDKTLEFLYENLVSIKE